MEASENLAWMPFLPSIRSARTANLDLSSHPADERAGHLTTSQICSLPLTIFVSSFLCICAHSPSGRLLHAYTS
jgi:hypothetical protein